MQLDRGEGGADAERDEAFPVLAGERRRRPAGEDGDSLHLVGEVLGEELPPDFRLSHHPFTEGARRGGHALVIRAAFLEKAVVLQRIAHEPGLKPALFERARHDPHVAGGGARLQAGRVVDGVAPVADDRDEHVLDEGVLQRAGGGVHDREPDGVGDVAAQGGAMKAPRAAAVLVCETFIDGIPVAARRLIDPQVDPIEPRLGHDVGVEAAKFRDRAERLGGQQRRHFRQVAQPVERRRRARERLALAGAVGAVRPDDYLRRAERGRGDVVESAAIGDGAHADQNLAVMHRRLPAGDAAVRLDRSHQRGPGVDLRDAGGLGRESAGHGLDCGDHFAPPRLVSRFGLEMLRVEAVQPPARLEGAEIGRNVRQRLCAIKIHAALQRASVVSARHLIEVRRGEMDLHVGHGRADGARRRRRRLNGFQETHKTHRCTPWFRLASRGAPPPAKPGGLSAK